MTDQENVIVAIDMAQGEYRCIAAIANDKKMIDAIHNDLDVHMHWAQRLDREFPGLWVKSNSNTCVKDPNHPEIKCDCVKCQMKAFRGDIKNQWTFPLCFGSSYKSIAENLHLPPKYSKRLNSVIDEFWKEHVGVRRWHQKLKDELASTGCVTNPLGRKFRAPLTHNQMINYPIQSTLSDLVVEAMSKLAQYSVEFDTPELAPRVNIHDDLTFIMPRARLEELLPIIIETMLEVEEYKSWLSVPLEVEVSIGTAWGSLEAVGAFSSKDWPYGEAA